MEDDKGEMVTGCTCGAERGQQRMETLRNLEERLVPSEDLHACGCRNGATRQCGTRVERARCCGYRLDHVLLQHHERDDDKAAGLEEGSAHSNGDATTAAAVRHGSRTARRRRAPGTAASGVPTTARLRQQQPTNVAMCARARTPSAPMP